MALAGLAGLAVLVATAGTASSRGRHHATPTLTSATAAAAQAVTGSHWRTRPAWGVCSRRQGRLDPGPHLALEPGRRFGHGGRIDQMQRLAQLRERLAAGRARREVRVELRLVPGRRLAVEVQNQVVFCWMHGNHASARARISGCSATRIFFTALKIECFAAFVFNPSAWQISSIEQPW